ncbi:MAG: hypothetical protein Q8P39_02530 [Candidatus Yanofskybacteria bacterium]|nr:hypothetical protein [Candidatus Yanofskybacteria bacterium]
MRQKKKFWRGPELQQSTLPIPYKAATMTAILITCAAVVAFFGMLVVSTPSSVIQGQELAGGASRSSSAPAEPSMPFPASELPGAGNAGASPSRDVVTVTEVPDGEAPPDFRQAWVGVELPGARLFHGVQARGITSGSVEGPASYWAVNAGIALAVLAETNPEAAAWYAERVHPEEILMFRVRAEGGRL